MFKTRLWRCVVMCTFGCGALAACDDSEEDREPDEATIFEVQIQNVAPWTVLKSGTQAAKATGGTGPARPWQAYEIEFTAGTGQFVSFATMLGESNDWFFAPVTTGIPLYDASGRPVSGDVTRSVLLWDAGTEADQEPGVGDAVGTRQAAPGVGAVDSNSALREVPIEVRLASGATFVRPAVSEMIRVTLTPGADRTFRLRIENVSTDATLQTSQGNLAITLSPVAWMVHIEPAPLLDASTGGGTRGIEQLAEDGNPAALDSALVAGISTPISPGNFVLHTQAGPLFLPGESDRGLGMESLAEDGDNVVLDASLIDQPIRDQGSFEVPVGADTIRWAERGESFIFTFEAFEGDRLSFVTKFGMSNDWFFGVHPDGIDLWFDDEDDEPISGDITDQVFLYDLGTEVDEELAVGPNTGTQQAAINSGALDPDRVIREIDPAVYAPPVTDHLRVTITPLANLD